MSWVLVKRSAVAALAASALASCASNYASAPIALSDQAARDFKAWTMTDSPRIFAVTRDGAITGSSFCRFGANCAATEAETLARCETNAATKGNKTGCLIYAVGGKPLVDDPALNAYMRSAPAQGPAPTPARGSASALSTIRCVRNGQIVAMQDRVVEHSVSASASGQIVFTGKDSDGQPFTILAGAGDICQAKPAG